MVVRREHTLDHLCLASLHHHIDCVRCTSSFACCARGRVVDSSRDVRMSQGTKPAKRPKIEVSSCDARTRLRSATVMRDMTVTAPPFPSCADVPVLPVVFRLRSQEEWAVLARLIPPLLARTFRRRFPRTSCPRTPRRGRWPRCSSGFRSTRVASGRSTRTSLPSFRAKSCATWRRAT
jgi:hypothetical protein